MPLLRSERFALGWNSVTYPETSRGVVVREVCTSHICRTRDNDYWLRICRTNPEPHVALCVQCLLLTSRFPPTHDSHAELHQTDPTHAHSTVDSFPPRALCPNPSDLFRDGSKLSMRSHFEVMRTVVCHLYHVSAETEPDGYTGHRCHRRRRSIGSLLLRL